MPLGYCPAQACKNDFLLPSSDFSNEKGLEPESSVDHDTGHPANNELTETLLKRWKTLSAARRDHPCRKIVFTIKSHDQGWGGGSRDRGTYRGSYTWFDVGLERIEVCDPQEEASSRQDGLIRLRKVSAKANPENGDEVPDEDEFRVCALRTVLPSIKTSEEDGSIVFDHKLLAEPSMLQTNKLAERQTSTHVITWRFDDDEDEDSLIERGRGKATGNGEFVRNLRVGDIVTIWAKARFLGWLNHVVEVTMDVYWAV
jgi:hypothetical protein